MARMLAVADIVTSMPARRNPPGVASGIGIRSSMWKRSSPGMFQLSQLGLKRRRIASFEILDMGCSLGVALVNLCLMGVVVRHGCIHGREWKRVALRDLLKRHAELEPRSLDMRHGDACAGDSRFAAQRVGCSHDFAVKASSRH